MRMRLTSPLASDAERVWRELQKSETLQKVSRPLVVIAPLKHQTLPVQWEQGTTVRFRTLLLGVIPMGVRTVYFEKIAADEMEIQTREHDALAKLWDHRMHVASEGESRCRYTDDVEIRGGLFTLGLWLFAALYYRIRQHRWRRMAKRGFPQRSPVS